MKNLASWRTTVGGVVLFLSIVFGELRHGFDSDPATVVDWNSIVTAFGALWLGLSARDDGVTSEAAGAK